MQFIDHDPGLLCPLPPIDLLNSSIIYKSHQRVKKGEGKLRSEFSEEESSDKSERLKGLDHQMDMVFVDMFG